MKLDPVDEATLVLWKNNPQLCIEAQIERIDLLTKQHRENIEFIGIQNDYINGLVELMKNCKKKQCKAYINPNNGR